MAKIEILDLPPPLGGLFRAAGYGQKPPGYSEDMVNVRAYDVLEGRGRIGSRPGLVKAFQQLPWLPDFIVNGSFSADTDWTKSDGTVTITGGLARFTASSGYIQATVPPLTPGVAYQISYDLVISAGGIVVQCGGTNGNLVVKSGHYAEFLTGSTSGFKIVAAIGPCTATIDNVSVVEVKPVRLASVIRTFNATGTTLFSDEFPGATMSGSWSFYNSPAWEFDDVTSTALPTVASDLATTNGSPGSADCRAALLAEQNPSMTGERSVSVKIDSGTSLYQANAYLMMDMHATVPNPSTGGIVLNASVVASGWYLSLMVNGSSAGLPTYFSPGGGDFSVIRMTIDSANVLKVYWKDQITPNITYAIPSYTAAGTRVGFGLRRSTLSQPAALDNFSFTYISSSGGTPPEAAVFSANHLFYRESISGALAAVTASPANVNLASDRRIYAAARLDKLYIADYGIRAAASDGVTVNATPNTLDSATYTDWTTLGIDTDGDVLEILSAGTGATLGIYTITAVTAGKLNITPAPGAATGVKFRVLRYPKVFDAASNSLTRIGLGTLSPTVTSQCPAGCRSVSLWQDHLFWCNNPEAPNGWWLSAASYPLLYDYGDTGLVGANGLTTDSPKLSLGVAAATYGDAEEFAGLIGEPLVTGIPINDDILVLACKTSFYYFNGNPRLNGSLLNITREIGIVGIGAWCRTSEGQLIVLTPDGLYEISLQGAKPLSRNVLPRELIGLTDDIYEISLAYDVARRGVLISATWRDLGNVPAVLPGVHYFYDLRTGGFFPQTHASAVEPTAVVSYQPGGLGLPTVLWGCRDGYVRRFEDGAISDDGTNFTSYCMYGPFGGSIYDDWMLHEWVVILDFVSGNVVGTLHQGYNAQAARNRSARYTTTFLPGRNYNRYPRLRHGALYAKLTGTPGAFWAVEGQIMTRENVGRLTIV